MTLHVWKDGDELYAADINGNFAQVATTDPATGQLLATLVPTSITAAIAAAQAAANEAQTAATAAAAASAGGGGGGGGSSGAAASPMMAPTFASFTGGWLGENANQVGNTGTSATDTPEGLRFVGAPVNQNQNQLRGLLVPAPAAPYELVAHIRMPSPLMLLAVSFGVGFAVAASRDCDVLFYGTTQTANVPFDNFGRYCWSVTGPNDDTCGLVAGSQAVSLPAQTVADCWFRLLDDGVNLWQQVGTEGPNGPWHSIFSQPRVNPSGLNAAPDMLGLFISAVEIGAPCPQVGLPLICDYWQIRAPTNPVIY